MATRTAKAIVAAQRPMCRGWGETLRGLVVGVMTTGRSDPFKAPHFAPQRRQLGLFSARTGQVPDLRLRRPRRTVSRSWGRHVGIEELPRHISVRRKTPGATCPSGAFGIGVDKTLGDMDCLPTVECCGISANLRRQLGPVGEYLAPNHDPQRWIA